MARIDKEINLSPVLADKLQRWCLDMESLAVKPKAGAAGFNVLAARKSERAGY